MIYLIYQIGGGVMEQKNNHLYQMIYEDIVRKMKSGVYNIGDQLPTEKQLAENFDVSRITSKKALELLAEEGYINRIRGKGSFIIKDITSTVHQEVSREKRIIGFVLPDYSEGYAIEILKGIEEATAKQGMFIIHRRSYGDQIQEEKVIDELLSLDVIGLIIMPVHGAHYSNKILKLVIEGYPLVFVDRYLKGINVPYVGTDNIESSKKAVDYLIKMGHQHIAYIAPPALDTSTLEDRIEGYKKSHLENGFAVDEKNHLVDIMSTLPGHNTPECIETDIEKIQKHIQRHPRITCLFAIEYNIALLCREAIKRLKLGIPEDISILCFDAPGNFLDDHEFTHIKQKEFEMGQIATELIRRQINNEILQDANLLEGNLVVGKTTKSVKEVKNDFC